MPHNLPKLLTSLVLCQAAGLIGSFFTAPAIPTWYAALEKPAFSPPNWVFAPVWFLLYLMMGVALYLVWTAKKSPSRTKQWALTFFGLQLALNSAWSIIFFGLKNPFYALIDLIALLLVLIATILFFWKISRTAAWLLLPYLAWGMFAALLNASIWQLNF